MKIRTAEIMPDPANPQLLKISDLTIGVGERILCRSLSANMSAGETWSILGPNGSGKSTLLETLAGLRPPQSGEVFIDDASTLSLSPRELALRRSILFQKTDDAFPATVMETVLSGRHPHIPYWQTESSTDFDIARRALDRVDLSEFEQRDINSLSGGERQRVSIAVVLAQNTPIRLFDEPSNHLDLKHQSSILQLISESHQRLNLVVLQDINQAWRYTTHSLLLFPDGSTEHGKVEEMLTIDRLKALYGCHLKVIQDDQDRVFLHS